jgi:hypothetical protein
LLILRLEGVVAATGELRHQHDRHQWSPHREALLSIEPFCKYRAELPACARAPYD